jgi:hypothetical protein
MRALSATLGVVAAGTVGVATLAMTSPASGENPELPRAELAQVRQATLEYRDIQAAIDDGYTLLDVCFESAQGGMGYHYVKGHTDAVVDPLAPDALVYEPTEDGEPGRLVAVEYIVPLSLSNDPPEVLGTPLHENTDLGLWVLHAWIWKGNPDGVLQDYNPNVPGCPTED